jgi:GT2 family glycosyltransferase
MAPKVSIVITCYNLGAYLHEALESIARCGGPERYEVIVVDDGSTDPATRAVIAALDRERYTVLEQSNMGLAKARNNGIALGRAPYVLSLDADNRIHPAFLDRSIALLDAEPGVGIVYGDATYIDGRTGLWKVGDYSFTRLLQGNYIDACACFRRSVWEALGGYDEHMPVMGWEDWDLWLRCSAKGVQFRYVPEVFFDYRVRAGSMIHDTRKRQEQLEAYIFGKDDLRFLHTLRQQFMDAKKRLNDRQALLDSISTGDLVRAVFGRIRKRAGGRRQA